MIEEGTFTIFDNSGRELARVSKGSCFGELALLHQVSMHVVVKPYTMHDVKPHMHVQVLNSSKDGGIPGSGGRLVLPDPILWLCRMSGQPM